MVTGDGYGRRLWAYYVVLVFFMSSCIFFIFLYWGMVTGDVYGRRLWAYYVVLVFFISSCIFFIFLLIGDVYGRWLREKTLRGREKARETERDTSNRAFWGGKSRFGTESEREREGERELRQIKLFGVERHQFGTERKGEREREKERHREIRQVKLFGMERHQFETGTKGERERERERQRDTSNQAFWGGKTSIWDREEGRERERHREIHQIKLFGVERHQFGTERKGERERDTEIYVKSSFLGWRDTNLGQRERERERERQRHKEIRQIKLFGVERSQFGKDRESETDRDVYGRRLWAYYVVLVFFISSCIFLIFLYFSCIWGWLREMVTGEGFGPTT